MPLSDMAVRQARATGKDYTLPDFDGLSLAVSTAGSKSWHYRYYWMGRQKRMSLGPYPEVSLREARTLRDEARALVARGINPFAHRREQRAAARLADENTFAAVYQQWFAYRAPSLKDGHNTSRSLIPRIFARDVLPLVGNRPVHEIRRYELLAVIERIEKRGALSVAEKVRTWLRQMFRYALVKVPGLEYNPASDLDAVAQPLPPVNHNPFLRMPELPQLLQRLRRYRGRLRTQLGIRLLLLTGVRTGELRLATPGQFDLERGLWIIPPGIVKQLQLDMRRKRQRPQDIPPYIVPLSVQAIEIVRYMLAQFKPAQHYLFPHDSDLKKQLSENTLNHALKGMGYDGQLTGHGIRGTISTALNEIGYPLKWVDAQLSHVDPNQTSASYNHAEYVEPRRRMMQDWADRLDLFEQDQVDAASMPLTVRFEDAGVPPSGNLTDPAPVSAPSGATPAVLQMVPPAPAAGTETPTAAPRLPAVPSPTPVRPPVLSDIQRERAELFDRFDAPHNLPVAEFAKLAGKSRRWINYEIEAGNLLAISVGNRGMRVPDWHLHPLRHALVQAILKLARDADPWRIYDALTLPRAGLHGDSAIVGVTTDNFDQLVSAVLGTLKNGTRPSLHVA